MKLLLIIIALITLWILSGIIGFCLEAKTEGYKEASPYIIEVFSQYMALGLLGLLVGIITFLESIELPPKLVQTILNLVNHKNKRRNK